MTEEKRLRRGDQVPHFEVLTLTGEAFSYSSIWQRKSLVLVSLSPDVDGGYVSELDARRQEFVALDAECVITRDRVPGVTSPGALVADRWGEIVYVAAPPEADGLPGASELVEWIEFVQRRCPECEGEAK